MTQCVIFLFTQIQTILGFTFREPYVKPCINTEFNDELFQVRIQMKRIEIFDKPHDCPVKKEPILFAQGTTNTEIGIRARAELWLFCPWCGERLGQLTEAEYTGDTHLYGTNSDLSKHLPALDDLHRVNCGRHLRVKSVKGRTGPVTNDGICHECLMQKPLDERRFEYILTGQIVEL